MKTYKCKTCGATVKTETIKATGHKWDSGRVTRAATTSAAGVRTFTCTKCKATRTASIAKLPLTEVVDLKVTTKLSKVSKGKKRFTAKWKKPSKKNLKKIDGYQIQYSDKSNFAGAKTVTVKKSKKSVTVKKLGAKKTYVVRIRTYKKSGKITHYSKWSAKKKVTTKK